MIALLPLALAAIPGTPEPPSAAPHPRVVAEWLNDWLAIPRNSKNDNWRTNAVRVAVRLQRWIVVGDMSMLTDARRGEVPTQIETAPGLWEAGVEERLIGHRTDELVLTVSWIFPVPFWLAIGAGVRLQEDLRGEKVQNAWHELLSPRMTKILELDEERSDPRAIAVASWRDEWNFLQAGASASLDHAGALSADVYARATYDGAGALWWVGVSCRYRTGDFGTIAAEAASEHETGALLEAGLDLGGFYFVTAINPAPFREKDTVGRLGLTWRF